MEILSKIHKVERTIGGNVFLLADETLTLIDTGLPGNAEKILAYLRKIGRKPEELTRVILTHSHPDHIGSAVALQKLTRLEILAHAADTETIPEKGSKPFLVPRVTRKRQSKLARLLRRLPSFSPVPLDRLLREGDVIPSLGGAQVVHTPGHTPGSICLFLPTRKAVFTGDVVISSRGIIHRPIPHPGADLEQSEESLKKLAGLDFEACFFGHGKPLLKMAPERLRELLTHPPTVPLLWRVLRGIPT